MTAVAALTFGGLMTSCTKDLDSGGSSSGLSDNPLQNYEQAFLNTFGRPVDGFNWGFGENTVASTRAITRTIISDYDFNAAVPTKPTTTEMAATNFMKAHPSTVSYYKDINGGGGFGGDQSCYINADIKNVNIWNGTANATVYVEGECTSFEYFYIGNNSKIYLCENSKLTLDKGFQGNCKVYISPGAVLTINNDITTGNVSYYNNGGTFIAKSKMVVNGGNEVFCEEGTFKVEGELFQIQAANFYSHNTTVEISGLIDDNHATLNNKDVASIYYQEGGSFKATGNDLICNSGKFYINVNSSFSSIEVNNTGVIVNKAGTMTSASTIRVTNSNSTGTDGSVIINDGTLVGSYLGTEGGAFFENNGTANISGNTVVNSNNNTWVNNGTYNTGYFLYNAGSSQVINNCRLNVSEDFNINLGDNPGNGSFRMDSNAGVVTKNLNAGGGFSSFSGGPFYIYMGSGSVFEVTQTATINATKADYGIYNLGDEWAVFHANKIQCMAGQELQGYKVTYGGKLYVVSETTHFEQGKSGEYPYIDFKNGASIDNIYASNFHEGKPTITIKGSQTGCNPGYTGNGGGGGGSSGGGGDSNIVRVIAEDLTLVDSKKADFDFNDVVFDVEWEGSNIQITIRAAGGTLPLTVGDIEATDDQSPTMEKRTDSQGAEIGDDVIKYEVHKLFKVSTGTMVNTHATAGGVDNKTPVSFTIANPYPSSSDLKVIANYIPIRVYKGGKWVPLPVATTVDQSEELTACKVAVDASYGWCNERDPIDTVYPYIDKYGNNIGSRFRFYLNGDLTDQWWKETTKLSSDN